MVPSPCGDAADGHALPVPAWLLALALLGGCAGSSDGEQVAATIIQARSDTEAAARRYGYDDRAAFLADMAAGLAAISQDADRLFPGIVAADVRTRRVLVLAVESLRARAGSLYRRLDAARSVTADAWPAMSDAFVRDMAGLRHGLERVAEVLAGGAAGR